MRVRRGVIDDHARLFSDSERRIAESLAEQGQAVIALASAPAASSRADALVDGVATDFEALAPGATGAAVAMALSRAARHARKAVVDARASGLSETAAKDGVALFLGTPASDRLWGCQIIGDGFAYAWPAFTPPDVDR